MTLPSWPSSGVKTKNPHGPMRKPPQRFDRTEEKCHGAPH